MTIANKDATSLVGPAQTLVPATRNTAATGATVDLVPYDTSVIIATVGALVDGTHSLTLQDSDDGTTWADVAAGALAGAFVPLVANSVQRLSYMGIKRYVRVNSASSGATGCAFAVVVVRGHPRTGPTP